MDQREDDVPEMPAYPRNPKLRLIRPGHAGAADGLTSASELAGRARRRSRANRCLGALLNVVALCVLAAALFVGYKVWTSLRTKGGTVSATVFAEGCPKSSETAAEPVGAASNLAARIARIGQVRYDYWHNSPKELRPQNLTSARTYDCFVPRDNSELTCLKIDAGPGTNVVVGLYDREGVLRSLPFGRFTSSVLGMPYLVLTEDKGWICGTGKKDVGTPVADSMGAFNPARAELGPVYDLLCAHSAKPPFCYGVYFAVRRGKREFVRRVRFGETVSVDEVKPIVRRILQPTAFRTAGGETPAGFGRTVVFSDGNEKKNAAGPVEIPYDMPDFGKSGVDSLFHNVSAKVARTREHYLNLRAIAEQEDMEEAAWERKDYETRSRVDHPEVSEAEVEKAVSSGVFYYIRAKEGVGK